MIYMVVTGIVICSRLEDVEHDMVELRADLQREQSVSPGHQ